jgi:hypothetical protein
VAQVQVTIDNVAQNPSSAFTVSANTITFTSAPLSGTNNIYVYYTSPITQVIAPGQGTVNTNSLASGLTLASPNITTALTLTGASGTNGQYLTSAGSGAAPTWSTVASSQWTTTGSDIYYNTGNVGIGTTSPTSSFEVTRDTSTAYNSANINTMGSWVRITNPNTTSGTASSLIFRANNSSLAAVCGVSTASSYSSALTFATRNSAGDFAESGRFDSNGQFMVGTTTTGGIITASGAQGGSAVIRSINTTSSGGVAGVVSVLQSNGNSTSSSHFLGSTTGINGWYLYGNGTTSYSSDIRLKKNVQTARGYLNDIARLRVVKYQWIGDNPDCQQVELGLIAQEVEEVFPNLIQEHEIEGVGMRKNIKQSVLPFMLLKSIQELKAINDTQAATITALTARITALEGK